MRQAVEAAGETDVGDGLAGVHELLLRLGDATGLDEAREAGPGGLAEHMREVRRCQTGVAGRVVETERRVAEVALHEFTATPDLDALQFRLKVANPLGAFAKLPRKEFQQAHDADELFPRHVDRTVVGGAQVAGRHLQPGKPFPEPTESRG